MKKSKMFQGSDKVLALHIVVNGDYFKPDNIPFAEYYFLIFF